MSPQEFEQALHDAEVKLARLKALYEQWFQGIERLEPAVARKDLERSFDILKRNMPRNTALRFRTAQLVARYGTYGIYWSRISRQIEEGTYKRDIVRAGRKMITATSRRKAAEDAYELDLDVDVDEIEEIPDGKTDPGIVVSTPAPAGPSKPAAAPASLKPAGSFGASDLDAILGSLAQSSPPDAAQRMRTGRPISPFAMGAPRPGPAAASATFGKPKDKPGAAATAPAAAATPAPPPATPAPAAKPVAPAAPVAPAPIARPAVAAAIPKPAAPAVPRPAAPAPAPASDNLDERQMRAIYSRYVDARRQNNERTDVRYESLAESVQKMMPKLREKHAGKPIDFEIVLQNGKVGLKPKVGG